jgi:hypothetical protein
MSYSYADLLSASDEDLVQRHDQLAKSTVAGVDYYLSELRARRLDRINDSIRTLTRVIAAFTLISTIFVILTFLRS